MDQFSPNITDMRIANSWPNTGIPGTGIVFPVWLMEDFDEYVTNELTPFVAKHTKSVLFIRVSPKSMICLLTLNNGFDIRGESGCINPEHYNPAIGAKYALHVAVDKASVVIAYKEQDKLNNGEVPNYDTPASKE